MRKLLCVSAVFAVLCTGCAGQETYWEQDPPQLSSMLRETSAPEETSVRAVWIPVMHYADWMTGRSEEAFRRKVREVFAQCRDLGLNTVFLHVRAYADAYYCSSLFPTGAYLTGDYDPLEIMTEEAHDAGLSIHAWINPLRCQTPEQLAALDKTYPLRQWYEDDILNGTRIVRVDGRYWLNPAYEEVRQLVCDGVSEILEQYAVEGIHIDDYFYPTQDAAFDAEAFAESGYGELGEFRRASCNALVQALYDTVKAHDPNCIFSISPQGNLDADRETLYADAALWYSEEGYCDWMIPQLYYGFENQTCPFVQTLAQWQALPDAAELIVGLAAYKIGNEDVWAGSGSLEWVNDPEVLSRETELVLDQGLGISYYSFDTLFSPDAHEADMVGAERERIRSLLQDGVSS